MEVGVEGWVILLVVVCGGVLGGMWRWRMMVGGCRNGRKECVADRYCWKECKQKRYGRGGGHKKGCRGRRVVDIFVQSRLMGMGMRAHVLHKER